MKTYKLISAGIFAFGLASLAHAQTSFNPTSSALVVNVVGSTAFRNAVTAAEVTTLSNAGANLPGAAALVAYTTAGKTFSSAGSSGANQSNVYGYLSNGTEVLFRNDWTGSAAGLIDLTQGNSTLTFIPSSATVSQVSGGGTQFTGTLATGTPQVTMSDVQSADVANSIQTQGTVGKNFAAAINNAALQNSGVTAGPNLTVAAATFEWVVGAVSGTLPAGLTNITSATASALIATGSVPLNFVTGNSGDSNSFLVLVGRSEDSGSRIEGFAEAQSGGIGAPQGYGQPTTQFMLKQAGVSYIASQAAYVSPGIGSAISGFKVWPGNWSVAGESTLKWAGSGHAGYNSGGDVANILSTPNPVVASSANFPDGADTGDIGASSSSSIYFVSYLGTSDAATVTGHAGRALSYNGVPFSVTAAEQGQYTLWSYEHMYYLTSATGSQVAIGSAQSAADSLADTLFGTATATLSPVGIKYTDIATNALKGNAAGNYP